MQGVPTLAQEAVPAGSVARFVGVLVRLRARLAPLVAPPDFSSPRQITWHGAAAGACSLVLGMLCSGMACRCWMCILLEGFTIRVMCCKLDWWRVSSRGACNTSHQA